MVMQGLDLQIVQRGDLLSGILLCQVECSSTEKNMARRAWDIVRASWDRCWSSLSASSAIVRCPAPPFPSQACNRMLSVDDGSLPPEVHQPKHHHDKM